jgi:acetyl esterase/lipase
VPAEHRYGRHASQVADLHLPDGPDVPPPVAVVLHGGFWRARYGRELMDELCRDLAAHGWAAWNVEYRRVGLFAGGGWPDTFADVAAAIDHLARVLEPLDLERVVAVGHSAGGQLALWAAARGRLPAGAPGAAPRVPVRAAVGQAAVSDLEEADRLSLGGGSVRRLLGGGGQRRAERYALASPAALLPIGVPQLLVHGGRDEEVPVSLSERYAQRARAAGDEVDLAVRPEDGHYEHLDPGSEAWRIAREWMERQA